MPNPVFSNSASRRLGRRVASLAAALAVGAVLAVRPEGLLRKAS
ncbi:hypothetical protein [Bordetella hinzii]|nr:hypothetical protein [Bordetella hinzii]KCB47390.1 hypothetical protein L538_1063 [Bordetella hinzii 4161]